MYTLEQLRDKTFKELKGIGWELNVLPAGDRRCRQNWIDAIAGVNPPLLALLEVSPVSEVELVAEAIEIQVQEPIAIQAQEPMRMPEEFFNIEELFQQDDDNCPVCGGVSTLFGDLNNEYAHGFWTIRCTNCYSSCCTDSLPPCLDDDDDDDDDDAESVAEPIEIQRQEPKFGRIVYPKLATEPIAPATETSPGVENCTEADSPPNRGDTGRGRIESEPKLSQSAIAPAAKTSPGVSRKTSIAHQLLELFQSSAHIIEDSPAAQSEAEVLESAISLTGKKSIDGKADRNPILTGVTFSDSFLARYSPPPSETIHYQADADGQLSFLDFEVESVDEPPDPDDFECMFAFWAAYDAWCDRTDDDSEQFEPLEISLTSMCEWAPCPLEWYEPAFTNETNETVSCTLEISPVLVESSSTCKFLIPVFDGFADRPNRQNDKDEPPDTGIFARLPGPKPPKFPPASVAPGDRTNGKKIARSAILLSGRAPPGGDAM